MFLAEPLVCWNTEQLLLTTKFIYPPFALFGGLGEVGDLCSERLHQLHLWCDRIFLHDSPLGWTLIVIIGKLLQDGVGILFSLLKE